MFSSFLKKNIDTTVISKRKILQKFHDNLEKIIADDEDQKKKAFIVLSDMIEEHSETLKDFLTFEKITDERYRILQDEDTRKQRRLDLQLIEDSLDFQKNNIEGIIVIVELVKLCPQDTQDFVLNYKLLPLFKKIKNIVEPEVKNKTNLERIQ